MRPLSFMKDSPEQSSSLLFQEFAGLGLRPKHYPELLDKKPKLAWFEAITENYLNTGGRPLAVLEEIRKDYRVHLHGVSLNIGSQDALNREYLLKLKSLIKKIEPSLVTDHLCWGGAHGRNFHDLLPLAHTQKELLRISDRIKQVQDYLGHKIGLENVSSYVRYSIDEMEEWEFLNEISFRSDCLLLIDINNIYVNSVNHTLSAEKFIDQLSAERVVQIHLAGHTVMSSGFLFDTHDAAVCDEVWRLFAYAMRKWGPRPFMIERDGNIPTFSELFAELQMAEAHLKNRLPVRAEIQNAVAVL